MRTDEILARLVGVKREKPGQFTARCPAHDDHDPSLAVREGNDGRTLLHCHVGCETEAILAAVHLKATDLFTEEPRATSLGRSQVVATYAYRDERGELLFEAVRFEPGHDGGKKSFRQRRPDAAGRDGWTWNLEGVRRVLYRLPELLAAPVDEPVLLVEGEKDVESLRQLGFTATTNPMGAGKWGKVDAAARGALAGRPVVIIPDNDDAGRHHARAVFASLQSVAASVCVLELPDLMEKGDASDWITAGGTAEQLRGLVAGARGAAEVPTRPGGIVANDECLSVVPDDQRRAHSSVTDGIRHGNGSERSRQLVVRPLDGIDCETFAARIVRERAERQEMVKRRVPYQVPFLDDLLGGILPTDLVLLTSRSGAGKTQMAAAITESAAMAGQRVTVLALEAEQHEYERRIKFRRLARHYYDGAKARGEKPHHLVTYREWYVGNLDEVFGDHEETVEHQLAKELGQRIHTVYRGADFTVDHVERVMLAKRDQTDLFVLDHLHFLDLPDEKSENAAIKVVMKRLRDMSLRLCKPVLLIAHMRKADRYRPTLLPTLDDIHGSSDIVKICTQVVALGRGAPLEGVKNAWWMSTTYVKVLKDRLDGEPPEVAMMVFDKRIGAYRPLYRLGRIKWTDGEESWEEVDPAELPPWARRALRTPPKGESEEPQDRMH